MGRIVKEAFVDIRAMDEAMHSVGDIELNDNLWLASAAFVEADECEGETSSGVLVFIPGVSMHDVFGQKVNAVEEEYYGKLAAEEGNR